METTEQRLIREFNLVGATDVEGIVLKLKERLISLTSNNRKLAMQLEEANNILARLAFEQQHASQIMKVAF